MHKISQENAIDPSVHTMNWLTPTWAQKQMKEHFIAAHPPKEVHESVVERHLEVRKKLHTSTIDRIFLFI